MVVFVNSSVPICVRSTEKIIASAMLRENGCPVNCNMPLLWKLSAAILISWHRLRRQHGSMLQHHHHLHQYVPIPQQHSMQTPPHYTASHQLQKIQMSTVSPDQIQTHPEMI